MYVQFSKVLTSIIVYFTILRTWNGASRKRNRKCEELRKLFGDSSETTTTDWTPITDEWINNTD